MMKVFLCLLFVSYVAAMAKPSGMWEKEWGEWKVKFGKSYANEEIRRKAIWENNMHYVIKHNYEFDQGVHTYRLGMNQFADLESKEFKALFLSNMQPGANSDCKNGSFFGFNLGFRANPVTVDWSKKGYVTPVKNQLQCGSCWAFSTTGSVEGQHFAATGQLVSLSEQNLMDCSVPEGDQGCSGGLMDYAFEYIITNEGIDTEASYPYEAKQGTCRFSKSNIGATISSCVDLPTKDESALEAAVASVGPISVAIDAGHPSFQMYESGVYYEPECSETLLDHGVLAVGYGSDGKDNYWLVKNSWGIGWGSQGYIKMSKGRNNNCGIATKASYPIV